MIVTVAVLLALFILGLYVALRKPKWKLPPGPPGLPLIGNLHQLTDKSTHKTFTTWAEKYGDVFLFRQLGEKVIVVSSYDLIYEVLVTRSNDFAGRPQPYRATSIFGDDLSFGTFTPEWVWLKKRAMLALKMYGDGLANLEQLSLEFIDEMMGRLNQNLVDGSLVDVKDEVHECAAGIMSSVLWGQRLWDDQIKILRDLERDMLLLLDPSGYGLELELFPVLRYLPLNSVKTLKQVRERLRAWIPRLNAEVKDRSEDREPTCAMEAIIHPQGLGKEENYKLQVKLSDDLVSGVSFNLMSGGIVTTSTAVYCLVSVLIHNPSIQTKLTKEIHSVLGQRTPTLRDRTSLPYVEATILETLRYATILPTAVPHLATKDTTLDGYDVPKGTMVLVNLWNLHHSEKYWDDPWTFKPERFLTDDGKLISVDHINRKRMMAFSAGRRVCPGEVLARNRMFLIVTSLLQKFNFKAESDHHLPVVDPREYDSGIVICPPPFNARLVSVEE